MRFLNLLGLAAIISLSIVAGCYQSCAVNSTELIKDTVDERGLYSLIVVHNKVDTVAYDYLTEKECDEVLNK